MGTVKLQIVSAVSLATILVADGACARTAYPLPFEPRVPTELTAPARLPYEPTPVLMPVTRYLAAEAGRDHDISTGDLTEMQQSKRLRILMLREQAGELGSRDIGLARDLIVQFAKEAGLAPEWVWVDTPRDLPLALAQGRGDVVIGDIPLDDAGIPAIDRTVALKQVRYVVITRAEDRHIRSKKSLYGLRAGLSESSPTWTLLERMSAGHPPIRRIPTDGLAQSEVFDQLAAARFDFTVVERSGSPVNLDGHPDLRQALELTGSQPVAWLVRHSNPDLRAALNHHINKNRLALRVHETRREDLEGILKRDVLRVITRPDHDNFFISNGERAGFEYDMIREFCLRHGLRIEVLLADSDQQMLAWLKSGVGDVVTARIERGLVDGDSALASTRMYHYVAPVLVGRTGTVASARLPGGRVLLPADSPFTHLFERTGTGGPGGSHLITRSAVARSVEETVDAVAAAATDYTVLTAPQLKKILGDRNDVRAVASLRDERPYRFTVRVDSPALRSALDDFLRREYGSEFYNAAKRRYFDNDELYSLRGAGFDRISPFDELVQRYAERYGFDWRLIVAQMYEESRFEPDAVSSAGARGLMQVLPLTARALGFRNLDEPEPAIHAGVKYLDRQRRRFEDTLGVADRTWFALAAYHAGYDRVQAARRRARALGLDPNRWFAHVEKAMLDISRNPGSANTYRGGRVTVDYVRDVRSRYEIYLQLQPATVLAAL